MSVWTTVFDVLVLLSAAMVLGAICERFRQSALLGYLLAGTLLGPNALAVLKVQAVVSSIAEIGVALLLFTIGLDFSFRRVRSLGLIVLGGGSIQTAATFLATTAVCLLFKFTLGTAVAIGAMLTMSSTALIVRLLIRRAEIDANFGRTALGVTLLHDMAVIPLVLLVEFFGGRGTESEMVWQLGKTILYGSLLAAALYFVLNRLAPIVMARAGTMPNRDVPILLAVVMALGAAWAASSVGLSAALGAFVAGMILAETPFSDQIRGDIASLRTLFVTLFFSSIGTQADPVWIYDNWLNVFCVIALIIGGKTLISGVTNFVFGMPLGHALAAAFYLAQVGEFAFVLSTIAVHNGALNENNFRLIVSATIGTLFLSPFLVALGPHVIRLAGRLSRKTLGPSPDSEPSAGPSESTLERILIIGFGPAGQRVAEGLISTHKERILVVELNSRTAELARGYGLRTTIGDACKPEFLDSIRAHEFNFIVVTVPDPRTTRGIIAQLRATCPSATLVVRARYHIFRWELALAGAQVVVDEEDQVGRRLAIEVRERLLPAIDVQ